MITYRKASAALILMLLACCLRTNAQYVGAVTPPQVSRTAYQDKLIQNYFTLKCGLLVPSRQNSSETATATDISNGHIAMNNGFFAEIGYGMRVGRNRVGFYFYPLLVAAYMSGFEFKNAIEPDLREFTAAEIAQRYGVFYEPVHSLVLAGYYRPAALVPVGFNSGSYTGSLTFEDGFAGKMFTHSLGIALQYSVVSLSYEYYMGKPLMEIKDNITDESFPEQVPLRFSVVSLAFNF